MNLWKRFEALTPSAPRHVGEVIEVLDYPYCYVTLVPSGDVMKVQGPGRSLEVGQRWLIEAGRIIEEGPTGAVVNGTI